ncbi:MAG: hypothetical protein KKH44_09820, partial [Bacteroidetes bacterium]|nr:hypothetical protein [Bacteroidota bacterium]
MIKIFILVLSITILTCCVSKNKYSKLEDKNLKLIERIKFLENELDSVPKKNILIPFENIWSFFNVTSMSQSEYKLDESAEIWTGFTLGNLPKGYKVSIEIKDEQKSNDKSKFKIVDRKTYFYIDNTFKTKGNKVVSG